MLRAPIPCLLSVAASVAFSLGVIPSSLKAQVLGISDLKPSTTKELRLTSECPEELVLQMKGSQNSVDLSGLSERAKTLMKKEAKEALKDKECYVRFVPGEIDVNGMQIIKRSEVIDFWEVYNYRAYGNISRVWNFLYKVPGQESLYLLKVGDSRTFSFGGGQNAEALNLFFRSWMAGSGGL